MDTYYLKHTDEDLMEAMNQYEAWLDEQLAGTRHKMTLGS
jgi:hypothetical protein